MTMMVMIFIFVVLVMGFTSFYDITANIFNALPNGTIYVNLGNRVNDSCAEILFIALLGRSEKFPFICSNETIDYSEVTFEVANTRCDLINIQSLKQLYQTNISHSSTCPSQNTWFWVRNISHQVEAEKNILIENGQGDRCRERCEECILHDAVNNSAIAVRFELLDIQDQPSLCSRSTESPTSYHPHDRTTLLVPEVPRDSKIKYVWFGIAAAVLISLLILTCIFCKVCSGTATKAEVPYAEPSDIVRSVTSEYSTPYDARSSTSGIIAVKAKPKPKVKVKTSIRESFKNPFKRFHSSKRHKKPDEVDSGYCEIDARFTRGKTSVKKSYKPATEYSDGKKKTKCVEEKKMVDTDDEVKLSQVYCTNVNPYAVVFLEE